jgi:DNA gyrase subunit A
VPQQSRAATGVRLQRLDAGDRLTEVVLVPPAAVEADAEADDDGDGDGVEDLEGDGDES